MVEAVEVVEEEAGAAMEGEVGSGSERVKTFGLFSVIYFQSL